MKQKLRQGKSKKGKEEDKAASFKFIESRLKGVSSLLPFALLLFPFLSDAWLEEAYELSGCVYDGKRACAVALHDFRGFGHRRR